MAHERWRHFGAELRRLRAQAGLNQQQLGKRVGLSHAMIGALERAKRQPKPDYADALDQALETGGTLSRIWHDVSGRADVPPWFRDTLALERQASDIRTFESLVVPGMLQTKAYAQVLDTGQRVRPDPKTTEEVVKVRTSRLEAVQKNSALLSFVLSEALLRNAIGGPEVMREQLTKLAKLAESGDALIQVLTDSPCFSVAYPFRILTLRNQSVAYAEHAGGGELIDRQEEVGRLALMFSRLQAEAKPPGESAKLIRRLEETYREQLAHV